MTKPQQAARQAEQWLRATRRRAGESFAEDDVREFCSALSTWGAVQRNVGQPEDARLAHLHALEILRPQLQSTEAGFAFHRLTFALGDLGENAKSLSCAHQALVVHQLTPGGGMNRAIAWTAIASCHLFYRRDFDEARLAYQTALDLFRCLGEETSPYAANARLGMAHSYLMEGSPTEAQLAIDGASPSDGQPDWTFRVRWLEAEISAAQGKRTEAVTIYSDILASAGDTFEPEGLILVAFDAAALLIGEDDGESEEWHLRIRPIVEQLGGAQQATLEPFLDALAAGQLDRELLDQTAAAYKRSLNRMLLTMGRTGAPGRRALQAAVH